MQMTFLQLALIEEAMLFLLLNYSRGVAEERERERERGRECISERAGNRLIALRARIAEKGESPSGLNSVGGCMAVSVV